MLLEQPRGRIHAELFQLVQPSEKLRCPRRLLEQHPAQMGILPVVVDGGAHELSERVVEPGRQACGQTFAQQLRSGIHMGIHQGPQHRIPVGEVLIKRSDREAGPFGDAVGGTRGVPVLGENVSRRVEVVIRRPGQQNQGTELAKEPIVRTVHVETILPANAERVWTAMLSPATFLYVCKGLFGFPSLAGRTEWLKQGERVTGWFMAFHVIPAYRHTIEVVRLDEESGTIRTHEHGGLLKTWNHTLHVEPLHGNSCRYSDTVEIDAGVFTGLVAAVAHGIYRYRQRRWHKLVCRDLS